MDETLLLFRGERPEPEPRDAETLVPRALACPVCRQHFSGIDARFCPFDGEKLEHAPNWNPAADPLIGTVVDRRYEVLGVLGEGGMGTVYCVRHATLGRQFALKALRRDLSVDRDLSARFIQEAKAAASVSHPCVVQITDFGDLPSRQPYFVMELLTGHTLSWLLKRGGPLPAARAVRIVRQVAEALGAAHAAGVVHRDLKPDNIHVSEVVGDRDIVKVLDFGLAKVAGASRLTRAGMVFGTPHYMSPEQATGDPVDHRTDIYALGVVMYEMFTARVPFEADSYMGVLTKHMYVSPTPPSQLLGGTRELGALEAITLRCLEKKPQNRFATMSDLLDELDRVIRVGDAGELEVRPAPASSRGVKNLLADALEAPSAEELRIALGRSGRWPSRTVVRAAIGAGSTLAVALALGIWWAGRSTGEIAPPESAMSAAASADPVTLEPAVPPGELPAPAPAPAPGPLTASSQGLAETHSQPAPPPPRTAGNRRPARAGAVARPALGSKKPKRGAVGAGEIVDPWAE